MRSIATALFVAGLLFSAPTFAAPNGEPIQKTNGNAAADDHEKADDHGKSEGHHYLYTADSDHDGKPNWMDSTDGDKPNEHFPLWSLGFHLFNLLLFIGIVFYYGRRPIMDSLASRALGIRKELTDSARVRDEARQRSADLGERLDRIEAEIAAIHEKASAEAANEEAQLIKRAHLEAERISEAAQRSIRDEVARARFALKRDAVALAIDLAEAHLKEKMNPEHQQRLAHDFITSIKNGGENRV